MEKNLTPDEVNEIIEKILSDKEINKLNPLALAWVGDSVFSNFVRKFLTISSSHKISKLHKKSTRYVKAQAQAELVSYLDPYLNEREKSIVKKGRNTNSKVPKHSSVHDYRLATGFEALIGYLELTGQYNRLNELCYLGISHLNDFEE